MFPEGEIIQAGVRLIITTLAVGTIGGGVMWLANRWGMFLTQKELDEQKALRQKQQAARRIKTP